MDFEQELAGSLWVFIQDVHSTLEVVACHLTPSSKCSVIHSGSLQLFVQYFRDSRSLTTSP